MPASFWKTAAAALPPHVRRRYAKEFEAAERYEPLIDLLVDSARYVSRALALGSSYAASALRVLAQALKTAAQRLTLIR